jgi:hypothetical protein
MESNVLLAQCPYFPALSLNRYMCSAGLPGHMWLVIRLATCAWNIGAAAAMIEANFDQGIMIPLVGYVSYGYPLYSQTLRCLPEFHDDPSLTHRLCPIMTSFSSQTLDDSKKKGCQMWHPDGSASEAILSAWADNS